MANITMGDDEWVGLGASAGRIEFDDQATDEVNFRDCRVGVGTDAPRTQLEVRRVLTTTPGDSLGGPLMSELTYDGTSPSSVGDVQGAGVYSSVIYGSNDSNASGSVLGVTSAIAVEHCADADSEMAPLFLSLGAKESARLWGIDMGIHGPYDEQADLLTGLVNVVNNYNSSSVTNGATAATVMSAPGCGANHWWTGPQAGTGTISSSGAAVTGTGTQFSTQLRVGDRLVSGGQTRYVLSITDGTHLTVTSAFSPNISGQSFTYDRPRDTYALDAGLAIVGWSGASNRSVLNNAFARALQIGGRASGWMPPGIDTSRFATGIDLRDYVDCGISIHDPQSGGTGYAITVAAGAGSVGIGTTSPDKKLTINGGSDAIGIQNSGTTKYHIGYLTNGLNFAETMVADGRLFLKDGGNVGVGTTGPADKLDAFGTVRASYPDSYWASTNYLQVRHGGNGGAVIDTYGSGDGGKKLYFRSQGSDTMMIDNSGNVGIGTTNPSSKLTVSTVGAATNCYASIDADAGSQSAIGFCSAGTQKWALYRPASSDDLRLWNTSGDKVTFLQASGNVGIATTSPGEKLEVNGNIKVSGSNNSLIIDSPRVPSSSSDSNGAKGQIAWDSSYLYVKTQTSPSHVWKRVALATW